MPEVSPWGRGGGLLKKSSSSIGYWLVLVTIRVKQKKNNKNLITSIQQLIEIYTFNSYLSTN